jgi:hypothetical protein
MEKWHQNDGRGKNCTNRNPRKKLKIRSITDDENKKHITLWCHQEVFSTVSRHQTTHLLQQSICFNIVVSDYLSRGSVSRGRLGDWQDRQEDETRTCVTCIWCSGLSTLDSRGS